MAAITQLLPPSQPAQDDAWHFSGTQACVTNPRAIVTRRRAVQVSRIEIAEPEGPQQPHTAKQDKDSWAFAFSAYTQLLNGDLVAWCQMGKQTHKHTYTIIHARTNLMLYFTILTNMISHE